jgi:hydrogenase nickel incorporation protein HypB
MCTSCGCGSDEVRIESGAHEHLHVHGDGTVHAHAHDHDHDHAPAAPQSRRVQLERDILAKNDRLAADNRAAFAASGVFALNLVSSPGSGKTTLLVRTIEALNGRVPVAVIEGDQQTSLDADRIRATGARAVQVNTGSGCHLDALMVGEAAKRLAPLQESLLFIENVGNLVCPAAFDLGEAHKVLVLSVTEGEDKPLKYPDMFAAAHLMLLNKCDLLPYLDFDVARCEANARRVNPAIRVLRVSATKGEGMDAWIDWLAQEAQRARRPLLVAHQ